MCVSKAPVQDVWDPSRRFHSYEVQTDLFPLKQMPDHTTGFAFPYTHMHLDYFTLLRAPDHRRVLVDYTWLYFFLFYAPENLLVFLFEHIYHYLTGWNMTHFMTILPIIISDTRHTDIVPNYSPSMNKSLCCKRALASRWASVISRTLFTLSVVWIMVSRVKLLKEGFSALLWFYFSFQNNPSL